MIMMEEFRRRKNLEDYYTSMIDKQSSAAYNQKMGDKAPITMSEKSLMSAKDQAYHGSNVDRYFEPGRDEIFDPSQFSLIFIDSDSVTNVTSLNRTNARRVLIFVGNGSGIISYGKGKAEEYEQAFDNAFKKARQNMVCMDLDETFTSPRMLSGRHNDFKIKIFPQAVPNYWGNPTIWEMLKATGFFHCRFTCISRKRDPYSLIYGYFNCVTKNRSTE